MRDNIETIVSLSPMQEGMLFHTLAAPEGGMYVQQLVLRVSGDLKISVFEKAWAQLATRHQALRSAFVWESVEKPLQVVFRDVPLVSRREDWRAEPEAVREQRWRDLVEADRAQGFVLRRPPLFRLTFVRMGERDYRFIFTYHHILLDGWSGSIVFKDALAFYDSICRGRGADLPAPIGLETYAQWSSNQTLEQPEQFYRRYLAGLRAPTPLYQDLRTQGATATEPGFDVRECLLSAAQTARLNQFAKAHRLTPSTVFQGAWAAILSRHSGERDVLFGTVSSGRPAELAGSDQMVGLYINTLPVRARIEPDDVLLPWLQRLQRDMAEVRQYDYVPLVKIHPWTDIPAGSPLFETCQVWENVALDVMRPFSLGDLEFTMEQHAGRASDPITVLAFPGTELKIQLLFDCSRIAPRTAERLLGHLETWLAAAPQACERRVVELPLLTPPELRQLEVDWMGPEKPLPPVTVHRLIAEQARLTPATLAVDDRGTSYTFRQLDERANQIAQYLRATGVVRGSRVGLCLRRSAEMVAAVLGVMKANAAYVPLDPAYPSVRLKFMAEDAQLTALIADQECLQQLPLPESRVLFLDRDRERLDTYSTVAPEDESQAEDVVYVLYTSGSTGVPKGVEVPQRALLNFLLGMQELQVVRQSDVFLAVTSLSFDIAGLELFAPLLVGARIVVAPQAAVADGPVLREWIERSGASVVQATPATWRMLLAAQWHPTRELRILTGGEALSLDLARELCASGSEVWNLYGPTETTIWSTAWKVEPAASKVSIGRPILNTQIYVIDANGQLAPVGVAGELLIGGLGVALGYLNRSELTAERFVRLPVTGSSRVYRTGDLVRWREDGTLDFLGRSDHQVKIRGHRVELGEIEAALNADPMLRHAAVSVIEDAVGEQSIVGYVVTDAAVSLAKVGAELSDDHADDWRRAWDDAYENDEGKQGTDSIVDPTFNTRGWNSSYDGSPIPQEQMREWLDATVSRIRTLEPRRILEIGSGTGMLLFRLARACETYAGTDFSKQGLANIAANLSALGGDAQRVSLFESEASDLAGIADESVDTVILNSVAQYFPSVAKALMVLERAIQKSHPCGKLFVGDVRDRGLHAAFWTSVHLHRAEPEVTCRNLRDRIERSMANEKELLLDREFFSALPGKLSRVASARLLLKRGRALSEMVRFRYDVVIRLDEPEEEIGTDTEMHSVDWSASRMSLRALSELLSTRRRTTLVVRGIPNGRTLPFVLASRLIQHEGFDGTLAALQRETSARAALAVDPEDIWALAETHGLRAELAPTLTAGDACFDATFGQAKLSHARRSASAKPNRQPASLNHAATRPWHEYGNNPLQGRLGTVLVPVLRRTLEEQLPSYMVPSAFVFLDALPLTPNGKVDRRALPHPGRNTAARSRSYMPPRDSMEFQLVHIWEDVLGVSPVGVQDNFFELGGHSIMAVRLIAQVEKRIGKRLPLSSILDARTVEALAQRIRATSTLETDRVLVCMQAGGKKPPLFCVHPAGGGVLCYRDLTRALGPDYPVYALEAALDANGAVRDRTVKEMVTAYVKAMQQVQPNGPYRVAGWSLGGLVAAEMAEVLRAMGESIGFVGLFDTVIRPPGFVPEFVFDLPRRLGFARYIEQYYGRALDVSEDELARYEGDELVAYFADRMKAAEVLPPDVGVAFVHRLFGVFVAHMKAYFEHDPSQFNCRMTLLRARTPLAMDLVYADMPTSSRTLGWSAYCTEPVNVIDVPGDHMTILSAGPALELAERLRAALDESESLCLEKHGRPVEGAGFEKISGHLESKSREVMRNA